MATETNTSFGGNYCCYSRVKRTAFNYLWIIEYELLKGTDQLYSSAICEDNGNSGWYLTLSRSQVLHIGLVLTSFGKLKEANAIYSISLLNDKSEIIVTVDKTMPHNFRNNPAHVDVPKNIIFNESNKFLLGDSLSILCKVVILENTVMLGSTCLLESILDRKPDGSCLAGRNLLAADLSKPFDNGKFSDFTLVTGDREFHSHKVILSARSEVFAAMFEHQMKENTLNRVVITDIKAAVLEEMLRFIYTGQSPNIKEMAKELFVAADKYALIQLSEDELASSVNVESAAEILAIAELYNVNHLKSKTIKFINLNAHNVIKTDGWKNLIKTHGEMVTEVYIAAVENRMANVKIN